MSETFENKIINLKEKKEAKINIGEVYFDSELENILDKEEFITEVQEINREIEEYLGENENQSVYNFRVYSNRKEYENYIKTNFPEKSEEYYMDNDMYYIFDEKNNKYFIGKFMEIELDPNDLKVMKYLEETKITFHELKIQVEQNYKYNVYPTIAHEMTHAHSFFKGIDYRAFKNKWAQEMICVFIDQKMWEKYVPGYKKMTETKAREQAKGKDLYDEIIKDFKEGDFQIEDWERFFYQFLENKYDKEKLKSFWNSLSENEVDFEQAFEIVFDDKLKDVIMSFQEEILN